MPAKWKCITNEAHVFDRATNDYLCTYCKQLGELSMIIAIEPPPVHIVTKPVPVLPGPGDDLMPLNGVDPRVTDWGQYTPGMGGDRLHPALKEVGLCVLVMDASSSMLEPAFPGNPLSRLSLVAQTAAYGVFDLQRMQNNPNAFVSIIVFDDRVKAVFPDGPVSIASLIKRFDSDVSRFADFLEAELGSMKQGTDINAALNEAYWLVKNFMGNKLTSIYDGHYSPVQQTILKYGTIDSVSIPNVRVLMYTDGMQYDARENRTLLPNPFSAHPVTGLNHDVLIGAYFGNANEDGAAQLSSLTSKCPIHNIPQFFLIDSPARINSLQSLFRMASGASGFCPKCLEASH